MLTAIFDKGEAFVISCLLSFTPIPFSKGSTLREKNLFPTPFSGDSFSQGRQKQFDRVASLEIVLIPLNISCHGYVTKTKKNKKQKKNKKNEKTRVKLNIPASILYKSIAGRYRPVSYLPAIDL